MAPGKVNLFGSVRGLSNNRKKNYNKKFHNGEWLTWSERHQAWGIFRPYRKNPKTGELEWAKLHGHRAWFIPVLY